MTLALQNIGKTVGGDVHLADISLELQPGSLNVLLGPTLAGKTSLMRIMAGLDRPGSGRLLLNGQDITGLSVRRRNVAMVYQQFINYPAFTVFENIASPLRRAGLESAEITKQVHKAAEALQLGPLLDRLPDELSGGQQQRTALARALVKEAELLLLDEPLVNLDYKLREELRGELQEIFRQGRAMVVYATTEPLEALMLGGKTVVVDEGRLLQQGATLNVYHRPDSERVGQVFSDPPMNIADGEIEGGAVQLSETIRLPLTGHLAALGPGRYRFGVRANHLSVARSSGQQVGYPAKVELAEISGSETFIHATHGKIAWVAQEEGVHGLSLGQEIEVFLDPRHLYVFDPAGRLVAAPPPPGAAAG